MTSHRMTGTPEYMAWSHMKRRCYNKKCDDYPNYGGAGIKVCDEWLNNFSAFYQDMGPRPTSKHSVDRRDGTLGYDKENCHWATKEQQSQNRPEFVIPLAYDGRTQTIAEWARESGIHPQTLYNRHNAGWPVERIIGQYPSNEIRKDNRLLSFKGETFTIAQWTKRLGFSRSCIQERLRRGWAVDRALSEGVGP